MDLTCLPASLHNRPDRIPDAVRGRIRRARADGYDRIFVAYADCGTGGLLDVVLEAEGVERLEGAHCYEVYAGRAAFAELSEEEPGTFYLTDFLVRNFDRLVIRGLGLDRHPELLSVYFGNYRRLVYLAQTDDPVLALAAARGADRLGLAFEHRFVGLGELKPAIGAFVRGVTDSRSPEERPDSATPAGRPASHARKGGPALPARVLPVESRHEVHVRDVQGGHRVVKRRPVRVHLVSSGPRARYMHPMTARVEIRHPVQVSAEIGSHAVATPGEAA
jgi:hypothetical protein